MSFNPEQAALLAGSGLAPRQSLLRSTFAFEHADDALYDVIRVDEVSALFSVVEDPIFLPAKQLGRFIDVCSSGGSQAGPTALL